MDDDLRLQDALSSIQAQMQEIDRMMMRVPFDGRISSDTKRKAKMLLKDINRRIMDLP